MRRRNGIAARPSAPAFVVLVALAVLFVSATPALALSRGAQKSRLITYAALAQNNSLRYLHTTWFAGTYRYTTVPVNSITEATGTADSTATIEMLVPPGGFGGSGDAQENRVRKQASASYATALALTNGTYNPGRTGVSNTEALRRVVAWNNALALSHVRHEWGNSWQSALWTYYLGAGSKRVWSSLPTATQELVRASVAQEADHLLAIPPPYYRNASGAIVSPGDSKSEENAWNAALLFLAARYWPADPHAAQWEAQGRCYAVTAYATRAQVGRDGRIQGSNLNNNGTVTNHGIVHPDYMATCGEMLIKDRLISAWTGTPMAPECGNGFALVWNGLTHAKFSGRSWAKPGGTIYRVNSKRQPTNAIYYPQGTDWSVARRHNHALMSVTAFLFRLDSTAYYRSGAYLLGVLAQQKRHADGRIFNAGETRFTEDEQFGAVCSAEMVEGLVRVP